MTIEIHTPELERRVLEELESGRFQDMDELVTRALDALQGIHDHSAGAATEVSARTCEEAVAYILEARKGNRLPEGVTIRALREKGRA